MPLVVCNKSARTGAGRIMEGYFYDAASPLVKAAPSHFVSVEEWGERHRGDKPRVHRPVEAATAAPGETRDVKKPAKKKSAAKKK